MEDSRPSSPLVFEDEYEKKNVIKTESNSTNSSSSNVNSNIQQPIENDAVKDVKKFYHIPINNKILFISKAQLTPIATEKLIGVLRQVGYRIREVPDSKAAEKTFEEENSISLILCTFAQSGKDTGLRIIQKMREKSKFVPFIMIMVTETHQDMVSLLLRGGASEVIVPPLNFDESIEKIRVLIELNHLRKEVVRLEPLAKLAELWKQDSEALLKSNEALTQKNKDLENELDFMRREILRKEKEVEEKVKEAGKLMLKLDSYRNQASDAYKEGILKASNLESQLIEKDFEIKQLKESLQSVEENQKEDTFRTKAENERLKQKQEKSANKKRELKASNMVLQSTIEEVNLKNQKLQQLLEDFEKRPPIKGGSGFNFDEIEAAKQEQNQILAQKDETIRLLQDQLSDKDSHIEKLINLKKKTLEQIQQLIDKKALSTENIQESLKILLDWLNQSDNELSIILPSFSDTNKNDMDVVLTTESSLKEQKSKNFEHSSTQNKIPKIGPSSKPMELSSGSEIQAYQTWEFNQFEYSEDQLIGFLILMFKDLSLLKQFSIPEDLFRVFLKTLKSQYTPNVPFHNFRYSFEVTHACYMYIISCQNIRSLLTPSDVLGLMLGALCSDIKHPGLDNRFHVQTKSKLALFYNDVSVLENFHASTGYQLIEQFKILNHLPFEQQNYFRRVFIHAILYTDPSRQSNMMSQLLFKTATNTENPSTIGLSVEKIEDRLLLVAIILRLSTLQFSFTSLNSKKWCDLAFEEFLNQGDKEKEAKIVQITESFDREKASQPKFFLELIDDQIQPLLESLTRFSPELLKLNNWVKSKRDFWFSLIPGVKLNENWKSQKSLQYSQSKKDLVRVVSYPENVFNKINGQEPTKWVPRETLSTSTELFSKISLKNGASSFHKSLPSAPTPRSYESKEPIKLQTMSEVTQNPFNPNLKNNGKLPSLKISNEENNAIQDKELLTPASRKVFVEPKQQITREVRVNIKKPDSPGGNPNRLRPPREGTPNQTKSGAIRLKHFGDSPAPENLFGIKGFLGNNPPTNLNERNNNNKLPTISHSSQEEGDNFSDEWLQKRVKKMDKVIDDTLGRIKGKGGRFQNSTWVVKSENKLSNQNDTSLLIKENDLKLFAKPALPKLS